MDWPTLAASSVLSAIFGGLISGFVTLKVAKSQYVNDYYKTVVQRRLSAYEQIENLITLLKTSVADTDDRLYHIIFSSEDKAKIYGFIYGITHQSMWLTDDVVDETVKLNRLLFESPDDGPGLINFAKNHYKEIAEIRTRLERLHARDFLKLHDVRSFLKGKRPKDSYGELPKRG